MRTPTRASDRRAAMNMTPMIDVVFLLIIFFLVSSHLARQETQLELDLPTSGTSDAATADDLRRVTINLLPTGETLLAGEPVGPAALAERLAVERAQAEGRLRVRIRGDRAAPYARVEPVLTACAEAGVWDVTFAVYSRQDRGR